MKNSQNASPWRSGWVSTMRRSNCSSEDPPSDWWVGMMGAELYHGLKVFPDARRDFAVDKRRPPGAHSLGA